MAWWGVPAGPRFPPVTGGGRGLPQHAVPGGAGPGRCQGHHGEGAGGGAAVRPRLPGGLHVRAGGGQGGAGRYSPSYIPVTVSSGNPNVGLL